MSNTLYHYDNNALNIHYIKHNKNIKTIAFKNNTIKPIVTAKKQSDNILDILSKNDDILQNISIYPIDTIADLKKKLVLCLIHIGIK